jgi:hypothetical protein
MIQSNVKGTFPCYAPEMDYPERTVPLSEELWDIPHYHSDKTH